MSGVTEQGQGTEAILAQIVAHGVGVPVSKVRIVTGDTRTVPYGGGTWACRGAGIGGEAALQSAIALKEQILEVAGAMLQAQGSSLDIVMGEIVDKATDRRACRSPSSAASSTTAATRCRRSCRARARPDAALHHQGVPLRLHQRHPGELAGGRRGDRHGELLEHWCVEDCGRVINPLLVDEQVRGGIVQGIGGALYEHCIYNEDGQLLTTTLADYLVPMAAEMPDMHVGHVETPTKESLLGAKGAGEAALPVRRPPS